MLTTTRALVEDAVRTGSAVAALNVITLEHAEGVLAGAERAGLPVVLQISENAVAFHAGRVAPLARAVAELAAAAAVPAALHLDHVQSVELVRAAPDLGVGSVMVDASTLPYEENVRVTAESARWAHEHGLFVEAELGEIGGKDGAHAPGVRTDPEEAAAFVAATGVDALAVAVGSSHAMTTRAAVLDLALVARLRERLPVPLVLHGSSGVPDDVIRAAVAAGIRKVNIGTILNVAFTGGVRATLAADDGLVDPRRYLAPAREALAGVVAGLLPVVSGSVVAPT